MSAHTEGWITFNANGAANSYALFDSAGRWWLSALMNGEMLSERQVANMRRLAACWNICDGLTTGTLENIVLTGDTMVSRSIAAQRDHAELLAALEKATAHIHPDSPDFAECERLIVKHGGGK